MDGSANEVVEGGDLLLDVKTILLTMPSTSVVVVLIFILLLFFCAGAFFGFETHKV